MDICWAYRPFSWLSDWLHENGQLQKMVYLKEKKFKIFGFFFFGVSCVQNKANHKNGYPFMAQFACSAGDVMKHCIPQNMMDDVNCYIIFPQISWMA